MSDAASANSFGTLESSHRCNLRAIRVGQVVLGVIVLLSLATAVAFPSLRSTHRRERRMAIKTPTIERWGNSVMNLAALGVGTVSILGIVVLQRHTATRVDVYSRALVLSRIHETTALAWSDIKDAAHGPIDQEAAKSGFLNFQEIPELLVGLGQKPMYIETRDGKRHSLSPVLERRDELFAAVVRHLNRRQS